MLDIHQIAVLSDNYSYLLHDRNSGETAVVDPAQAEPVLLALEAKGWRLTQILNTHHHWDHVDGNYQLKQATGCTVIGAASDQNRIPGIDQCLEDGDIIYLGAHKARVIEVPGHTLGHIAFWFQGDEALFCGDTVFALGCGRLFEGSPQQMWHSLSRLKQLPANTLIYCAHEYTLTNGQFALTIEVENTALQKRVEQVRQLRSENRPTVPSTLADELATNPFLRADQPAVKRALGLETSTTVAVWTEIRRRRNHF